MKTIEINYFMWVNIPVKWIVWDIISYDNSTDEGEFLPAEKTHAKKGSYNIQHLKPWGPVLIRFLPSFTVMFLFLFSSGWPYGQTGSRELYK